MSNSTFLPPARPDISVIDAIELAGEFYDPALKVWLLGRRGYYRDSMGAVGANDRNIYDDAIALITPDKVFTWNANTDPSKQDSRTHLATLAPGRWTYKLGKHHVGTPQAYPALVQAGPVTVNRDDGVVETGWFGINIHKGGRYTSTGSEGCQTIHPDQYEEFMGEVAAAMQQYARLAINYILTERT